MKNFSINAFALVALFAFSSVAVAQPVATYDPATGGITFTAVDSLVGLRINANATLPDSTPTDLDGAAAGNFGVVNGQPTFVEWGNLIGMTFNSAFGGNVLPTGLDQPGLDSGFVFLYRTSTAPGVDETGQLVAVPEPSSLMLAGLGLVGFISRRRRS